MGSPDICGILVKILYGITYRKLHMMSQLKLIPKITDEHVRLTPYSKMNVSFATQVLSKSVSNILYGYYPPETLNVRNQYEGFRKKKRFFVTLY